MAESIGSLSIRDSQHNCGELGFVLLLLASAVESWAADAPTEVKPDSPAPPVKLTSLEDHKRLLRLLGIQELRDGVDLRDPLAPNAPNYDESKANPYPVLPDPLFLENGQKVTSSETWWKKRRPEIIEHFDREVYGRVPGEVPQVKWELISTEREPGLVFVKHLSGRVDNSSYLPIAVEIQLTLETPLEATHPVPVILELALDERQLSAGGRGRPVWERDVVRRGWGYGTLALKSIQPDSGSGLTKGIIGLANKGQPRKVDDWGALRAWAWGASRALDYLETDKAVDARRVGLKGYYTFASVAIVAMAYDQRFGIGFIDSSGAGGAKLHRRNFGELVENLASPRKYHLMAGNYLKYAGPLTAKDLPVDAHELLALCAPRPVFIAVHSEKAKADWVDARGMFLAAVGAGPVYRLLGKKDLGTTEFPPHGIGLVEGGLAFREDTGDYTKDWASFLDFAERYFQKPGARKPEDL